MPALLLSAAAVLFLSRLSLLVALHVHPGGVHPVRDTVSDYAASRDSSTRRLSTWSSWMAAAAWAALGLGLLTDAELGPSRMSVAIWLLALALILAVMPWVPTDGPGAQQTTRGRVHLLFAIGWFAVAYATIGPLGRLLDAGEATSYASVLRVLGVVAAIALGALVVSLIVRPLRARTFGISERVFILVVTVAPLLASIGFATR